MLLPGQGSIRMDTIIDGILKEGYTITRKVVEN